MDQDTQATGRVVDLLRKSQSLWILSHLNPDADAYGSMCGLGNALKALGKNVTFLNISGILKRYDFIPGVTEVGMQIPDGQPDVIVICDCGALSRIGDEFLPLIKGKAPIINIDHHTSNEQFGMINLVREEMSSTSEIVFNILEAMGCSFDAQVAIPLFAGISGDTGSFRYSCTSDKTMYAAAKLVSAGANPHKIAQAMYANNALSTLKLQAEAISRMRMYSDNRVAEILIDQAMFEKFAVQPSEVEYLVELARDIEGVRIALFIREDGGVWRISMRSRDAKYNVAEIAGEFGGGGHKVAAAFRSKKALEEFRPALLERVGKAVAG